jgi:glycosyltransferase involved in cell wall biosynthesis
MISGIVITKNEEKNIIDCLESLKFCSEIIVLDDNSTDRTLELVKQFGNDFENLKFFKRELENDFSAQRKFGLEKTSNDWVIFLDADERIDEALRTEIKESLADNADYGGFLIPRLDYMWGKELKHGETGSIKLLRLFNKQKGSLKGKVHESWETKSQVGYLVNPIRHYPHPTISDFLREINFYTSLRADELHDQKKKANALTIIAYPSAKFIKNYFVKLGILDGLPGLVHAILMSFHSFLVRGKLWQLNSK